MRDSSVNSTEHKQTGHEECCDLYGEYCYPCPSPSLSANDKEKQKKQRKSGTTRPAADS